MEHLTITINAPHLSVLYHGQSLYDNGNFADYLTRRGWQKELIAEDDFTNGGTRSPAETRKVLLEWLYFGMIYEVLGDVVDDFLDGSDSGNRILTTRNLSKILTNCAEKLKSQSIEQVKSWSLRATKCVEEVAAVIMAHQGSSHSCEWPLESEATLCICLLLEALDEVIRPVSTKAWPITKGRKPLAITIKSIERNMVRNGWCPNHVKMSRSSFGLSSLFVASFISRPFQRHHRSCTEDQCVAYNVIDDKSVTKHVAKLCNCRHLTSPSELLESIVEAKLIPLIRATKTIDNAVSIELVGGQPGQNFVAISHVWSHGLGNAVANSLPICQVERILSLAIPHTDWPCYFWIDTLCIPREPLILRRKAIEGIRAVYEAASMIIVLDEELMASSLKGAGYEEILIRINISGWMRRLWTLHEQVRSKAICFQFADGTYSQQQLITDFEKDFHQQKEANVPFHNVLSSRGIRIFSDLIDLKKEPDSSVRMARLWSLLRWRHLSWSSDETICMANMLGISPGVVQNLLSLPVHSRMGRFLDLFDNYPASLVFLQVPKLSEKGKRWAPASWLHSPLYVEEQGSVQIDSDSFGIRINRGLIIRASYILLNSRDHSMFRNGRTYYLHISNLGLWFTIKGYQSHAYLTRKREERSKSRLLICLERCSQLQSPRGVRAVLVAMEEKINFGKLKVTCSKFMRNLHMTQSNIKEERKIKRYMGHGEDSLRVGFVSGHLFTASEFWCIG